MKTNYNHILIVLLALFSLAGCSLVNTLRIRNANDDILPTWENDQVSADLKTHYIGAKPYVEVSINGIGGFVFLIDTGASFSILMDTKKVKDLKLTPGYELELHGWGDEEHSPAYQTKVKNISLAEVEFSEVNFAYLPLSTSLYYLAPEELIFDGVLGHDILHHFSWKFDKNTNRISISKNPYQMTGEETQIPFDVSLSKLEIQGVVDFNSDQMVNRELVIDTGSRHYLKINAAYISSENVILPATQITASDFGLSGQTIHQRVTLPNLKLAGMNLNRVKTNIIGKPDGDEDDYWIVGSALLNQFVSIIDYHSSSLYLSPYHGMVFKSQYNLIGLELRKLQSGAFIVRYVFPQLAANEYDIKKGDVISKIDEQPAKDISMEKWLSISNHAGSHQICRTRIAEKCFVISSKEIKGYSIK